METVLEKYTTEEQSSDVRFLWAKGLNTKDIHKEMFPVYVAKFCRVRSFITGPRNSHKEVRKSQMTNQVQK
jgi:hypothetical protein